MPISDSISWLLMQKNRDTMFIQTEETPNPNTLKFIPGEDVLPGRTIDFRSQEGAKQSPLAHALFDVEKVEGVFLAGDFITVTKAEEGQWDVLKPQLLTTIMEHYVAGKPVMDDTAKKAGTATDSSADNDDDDPIVKTIRELIDTRVRPAVAMDGGDIVYHGFEDGVVKLEMHGACSGCPSSTATLKDGIENMLKHYVPEVIAVEAVNA